MTKRAAPSFAREGAALVPIAMRSGSEQVDQLISFASPDADLEPGACLTSSPPGPGGNSEGSRKAVRGPVVTGAAVLSALTSLATGVQVVRVGDSGARAVWTDRVSTK